MCTVFEGCVQYLTDVYSICRQVPQCSCLLLQVQGACEPTQSEPDRAGRANEGETCQSLPATTHKRYFFSQLADFNEEIKRASVLQSATVTTKAYLCCDSATDSDGSRLLLHTSDWLFELVNMSLAFPEASSHCRASFSSLTTLGQPQAEGGVLELQRQAGLQGSMWVRDPLRAAARALTVPKHCEWTLFHVHRLTLHRFDSK